MGRILSKFKSLCSDRPSKSSTSGHTPDSVTTSMGIPEGPLSVPMLDNSNRPQVNAPLEDLPAEIRRHFMSMLELEGLSALVHTSPVFHQQYLLDRRFLLCACLETTLRSTTIDACAVYRSSLAEFSDTRSTEKVVQFLQSYRDRRSSTQYSIRTESLTEHDAIQMAVFHSSIIKPLVRYYTSWALTNLAREPLSRPEEIRSDEPLGKTEEIRLLRALYRFQLSCNLFGIGSCSSVPPSSKFRPVDILNVFICIFEPWEVEELACIYAFSKEKFNQVFLDVRWDLHGDNPRFPGPRPPTPDGAFDLDEPFSRETHLKATISRGLGLLYIVIFTIRDHAHLVSIMQEQITWPSGHFLEDEAFGDAAQYERRRQQLSLRDQKQERRDLLPFKGDDLNGLSPPLAWTLMWRGTYSNLYGYYIDLDNVIRRWGYVMWNAARLERTGGKEVLLRQWEASWGDEDPRDNLF